MSCPLLDNTKRFRNCINTYAIRGMLTNQVVGFAKLTRLYDNAVFGMFLRHCSVQTLRQLTHSSTDMPKSSLEFAHVSDLSTSTSASTTGIPTTTTLSHDTSTNDRTVLLHHSPGSAWGQPLCTHEYWEEAFIIPGLLFDEGLQKWFEKGSYLE